MVTKVLQLAAANATEEDLRSHILEEDFDDFLDKSNVECFSDL